MTLTILDNGEVATAERARAEAVTFSLQPEDRERLDRLVEQFSAGRRSEFLREALTVMESVERAERLRSLQAYGTQRLAKQDLSLADISAVVSRVLSS